MFNAGRVFKMIEDKAWLTTSRLSASNFTIIHKSTHGIDSFIAKDRDICRYSNSRMYYNLSPSAVIGSNTNTSIDTHTVQTHTHTRAHTSCTLIHTEPL